MRRFVFLALLALAFAPAAHAGGPAMLVGGTEDAVKKPTLVASKAQMDLLKLAGLDAVRVTQVWTTGQKAPSEGDLQALRNVAEAGQLDGIRVVVSVSNQGSRWTPLSDEDQADFAGFAAAVAKALPSVHEYIVGNEPNLNRYWMPQFGLDGEDVAAPAYESLLAQTYDAIKAAAPTALVYGGAVSPRGIDRPNTGRDTHSPTAFIPDMGAAYRESGRTLPIMDGFTFHPYGDNSSQPPATPHTGTSIGIGDYDKLVALLATAFDGTAQLGSTLPLVYDEYGVETQIPTGQTRLYTGREPTTTKPVDEATQAAYYKQAIGLAFCQPNVRGIFLFHTVDESDLDRWQSGLFYANGKAKSSLPAVRLAAQYSRRGIVAQCAGLELQIKARADRFTIRNAGFGFRLRCDLDCNYRARLEKVATGGTTLATRGRAVGGQPAQVAFPQRRIAPGRYRFTV
ncbi:MAG TPA: hypothetical protein VF101_07325, partial [Gaiellaceae bacterium]